MGDLYPFCYQIINPIALWAGSYQTGKPLGITIHYTADDNLKRIFEESEKTGVGYHVVIDKGGLVYQTAYFNKPVAHAGKAMWEGLSPNRNHVAIAFLCWGKLTIDGDDNFISWAKKIIDPKNVRLGKDILGKECFYEKATEQQEKSLLDVVQYVSTTYNLISKNFCGHDECALPLGRKADPAGSLSFSMADLRKKFAKDGNLKT